MPVIPPAPLAATTDFGPVAAVWYNPTHQLTATVAGISDVQIGGDLPLWAAQTLSEYVNNEDNRTTIGGRTGVLDVFTTPYPVVAPFNGDYLFHSFNFVPYKFSDGTLAAGFTLTCSYLGDVA
jgi:hypothetical protein